MEHAEKVQHWLDMADSDSKTMEHLFQSGDYLWCLFLGHLVLEKTLKALFIQKTGNEPPRIHDLARLADECGLELPDEKYERLLYFTQFNIEARYPKYREEISKRCTKEFTAKIQSEMKETRAWLGQLIRKS